MVQKVSRGRKVDERGNKNSQNLQVSKSFICREEKLAQARREATDTIRSYEMEQKDKIDAEKEKVITMTIITYS